MEHPFRWLVAGIATLATFVLAFAASTLSVSTPAVAASTWTTTQTATTPTADPRLVTLAGVPRAGDYQLTLTFAPTVGSPVAGTVIQYVGGGATWQQIATFHAIPQGSRVTVWVRASGAQDVFQVYSSVPTTITAATFVATHFNILVRGTQFTAPSGMPSVWHGMNTDPWVSPTDIVGYHQDTRANIVRIPVSECKWMSWSGAYVSGYRAQMINLVNTAVAQGMKVILDLHWACHGQASFTDSTYDTVAQVGPDEQSIGFWQDAATVFKSSPSVMFELFNEPQMQPSATYNGADGDTVWLNGGQLSYGTDTWQAPGEQQLYDAVRSTGATNVVIVDGPSWAQDLTPLMNTVRVDGTNVAYALHTYAQEGQNLAVRPASLDSLVFPAIDPNGNFRFAGIATEFGSPAQDSATAQSYFNDTIGWLSTHGLSWTVWGWYPTSLDAYGFLQARPATFTPRGTPVLNAF